MKKGSHGPFGITGTSSEQALVFDSRKKSIRWCGDHIHVRGKHNFTFYFPGWFEAKNKILPTRQNFHPFGFYSRSLGLPFKTACYSFLPGQA